MSLFFSPASQSHLPLDSELGMSHGVNLISAASCTTTGLAHAVKPFAGNGETAGIITASMSTIHATTGNQNILLDAVPQAGVSDLRKNRQVFNNIILTTTGAAIALEEILPEIRHIGFMAEVKSILWCKFPSGFLLII